MVKQLDLLVWTGESTIHIPCALSKVEIDCLKHCRELKPGAEGVAGDIVEFGCFMGGSTVLLNEQLQDGESHYTYDLFKWQDWMKGPYGGTKYQPGDNFCDEFHRNTDWQCNRLYATTGRIQNSTSSQGQVKLIFVDAFKEVSTAIHGIRNWFSHLEPGGVVIDQDFYWEPMQYTYCHLFYYRLREYLKPIVRADSMLTMRVIKEIPHEFAKEITTTDTTMQELSACYEYWTK